MSQPATLQSSTDSLARQYDVALLDLDGVVYVGPHAVAGAPDALAKARSLGMGLAFVTNNAARTAAQVASHLSDLGIPAEPSEVTTSSQAAAHYLSERLPAGANVLAIGADGLTVALQERGLNPVFSADDAPLAVVQGYSPQTSWQMLAEATVAIRGGALWVATNLDATLPSPRGPLPGNGALVAAVQKATGATPVATGKPDPTMHQESLERSGASNPVVVGDRLDTDIAGAAAVGCASLLVLSGVTDAALLLTAPPDQRPQYVGRDVSALMQVHIAPVSGHSGYECGDWTASQHESTVTLTRHTGTGHDGGAADGLDPLRALCACVWANQPGGASVGLAVVGADADAVDVLTRLSLSGA